MTGKDTRLFLFATITPKPEFYDAAREAVQSIIVPTLQESGCHVFAQFDSTDGADKMYLFEIFESNDALDVHYEQNYTKTIFASYQEWLAKPVEVTKLLPGSPVTSEHVLMKSTSFVIR